MYNFHQKVSIKITFFIFFKRNLFHLTLINDLKRASILKLINFRWSIGAEHHNRRLSPTKCPSSTNLIHFTINATSLFNRGQLPTASQIKCFCSSCTNHTSNNLNRSWSRRICNSYSDCKSKATQKAKLANSKRVVRSREFKFFL